MPLPISVRFESEGLDTSKVSYQLFSWSKQDCQWGHDTVDGCTSTEGVEHGLECSNYEHIQVQESTFNLTREHAERQLAMRIRVPTPEGRGPFSTFSSALEKNIGSIHQRADESLNQY